MNPVPPVDATTSLDPTAYALGGRVPAEALRPPTAEAVAAILATATRDRRAVVLWGGGTRRDRAVAPDRYDVALDLTALDRIVDYDPEDLTLTAECGATIATLRAATAANRQELALESPLAGRATLGGVLATNDSGPRRLRFGSPRDRLLGARYALADGTLARSGGRVVKNVAGFAVHRLLAGSHGRAGALLEVSLKLAPAPEVRVVLAHALDAPALTAPFWSTLPRLEPSFVTVLGATAARRLPLARDLGPWVALIGLEDDAPRVAEQERALGAALGPAAHRFAGDDFPACLQALTDLADFEPRVTFTSAHNTVAPLEHLADLAEAPDMVFHAASGRLHWQPGGGGAALVTRLARLGFTPIAARGIQVDPAIPREPGLETLRRALDQALDPSGTLSAVPAP